MIVGGGVGVRGRRSEARGRAPGADVEATSREAAAIVESE
jgi:hypothetical protein